MAFISVLLQMEIGIYFCVTADILTKVLQKCSWSSPLQTIWILSKSLILIGCLATEMLNFRKNIKLELVFIKHYAPNICLSPNMAKFAVS